MLRGIKELVGFRIEATDGEIGKVNDFFFDDHTWTIRYLIADTGHWLHGRLVLLSTVALGRPDWAARHFPVNLTREKIENSPDIIYDQPISRQHEAELHQYYNWPIYWGAGSSFGAWGTAYGVVPLATPWGVVPSSPDEAEPEKTAESIEPRGDPNLRSASEVIGYGLHATDGDLGHVADFIVDDENWVIRYMEVHTSHWLAGRKVLIAPPWIKAVIWEERKVNVDLSREMIRHAPDYDPLRPIDRQYEEMLYAYYGRPGYWATEKAA